MSELALRCLAITQSLLLDEKHGCAVFRRAIHEMCCGHESCPPALYDLREKAVKLLFLERDAFKWYRDVKPQVSDIPQQR